MAKEKEGARVLVQIDGAANNRLLVLCCGRLLMSLGCEGRIDHLISIAKVLLRKKKGACFGAKRWGNKQSLVGAFAG
ncbi:hypothetical protein [Bartonella sp. OD88NMGDW]|uniref:hypothetical protein n=1 Tax=Bartonella sp. OD88NMGDW TaxID=3243571 RepID=UPI0035CE92C6